MILVIVHNAINRSCSKYKACCFLDYLWLFAIVLSGGKKTGVTAIKIVIIDAIIIEKKVKNRKTIKEIMVIMAIPFAPRRKSSIHTAILISVRGIVPYSQAIILE